MSGQNVDAMLSGFDDRVIGLSLTGLEVFRDLMQEASDDPGMANVTLTLPELVHLCDTCLGSIRREAATGASDD